LVTILINAALVKLVPMWIGRARLAHAQAPAPAAGSRSSGALQGHVVVCGFGRVGSAIGEALETFGVPYVAIETDPDIVKSLRARAVDPAARARVAEEGAREVLQPGLEGAPTLIRHALERLSLPRDQVLAYLNRYRGAMESLDAGGETPGAGLPRLHEISATE